MELVISRIEHLSTREYPQKPCSVVYVHGCPLRCSSCTARDAFARKAEMRELLELFEEGRVLIDAVSIAGCEPLMQPAALELASQLKERGFEIKLHTTGYYPDALERVVEEGIADVVEMEVKAPLDTERYTRVTRNQEAIHRVFQSLDVLSSSKVRSQVAVTIAPPAFSGEDLQELAHALACYGFRKLRIKQRRESSEFLRDTPPRKAVAACPGWRWSDSN